MEPRDEGIYECSLCRLAFSQCSATFPYLEYTSRLRCYSSTVVEPLTAESNLRQLQKGVLLDLAVSPLSCHALLSPKAWPRVSSQGGTFVARRSSPARQHVRHWLAHHQGKRVRTKPTTRQAAPRPAKLALVGVIENRGWCPFLPIKSVLLR